MKVRALQVAMKRALSGLNAGVQITFYSVLFSHLTLLPYAHADQTGGVVIGGDLNATIHHTNNLTTINQTAQNVGIEWQTFDVNTDERVQLVQPNSSSIALNRVLSNTD